MPKTSVSLLNPFLHSLKEFLTLKVKTPCHQNQMNQIMKSVIHLIHCHPLEKTTFAPAKESNATQKPTTMIDLPVGASPSTTVRKAVRRGPVSHRLMYVETAILTRKFEACTPDGPMKKISSPMPGVVKNSRELDQKKDGISAPTLKKSVTLDSTGTFLLVSASMKWSAPVRLVDAQTPVSNAASA